MRPEKLTIYNIGPFQGAHTIDFSDLGDIFLIYGKTGAGKTTIFDALSYAFYGEVPGGRSGIVKHMRSHFAPENENSIVELEYTISGRYFRVRRTLPSEGIGVRSGKIQAIPEEVSFEEKTLGGWENLTSTKKTDTDKAIIDLIGLSSDEFSRIVLLPQGEFSRFLKQNSTERKEVLAKLFPVSQYSSIIDLVRSRTREAVQQLKETENNVLSLQNDTQGLLSETDSERLNLEIEAYSKKQNELRTEISRYATLLEKARAIAVKKQTLANLREEQARLITLSEHIEKLTISIQNSRKARPIKALIDQLESLEQTQKEQKKERDAVLLEYEHSRENLAKLQNSTQKIKEHITEKETLLLKKEQLRIAVTISENLDAETTRRNQARKEISKVKHEIATYKAESDAYTSQIDELQNKMGDTENLEEAQQRARDTLEQVKTLQTFAAEFEKETRAIAIHEKTVETTQIDIKTNQKDLDITKEAVENLKNEIENENKKNSAHNLAKTLVIGQPCPVCGSKEHPSPAIATETHFSLDERQESLERQKLQLEKKHTELQKELSTREANLKNAQERLASIIHKIPDNTEIPSTSLAEEKLKNAVQATQKATDALNASRAARRETETIRKKKTICDTALIERSAYLSQVEKEETKADAAVKTAVLRYKEAGLEADTDAQEALEICTAQILTLDAKIAEHTTLLDHEKNKKAELEGRKQSLESAIIKKSQEIETTSKKLSQISSAAGFSSKDTILAAVLSEPEEEKREQERAVWSESSSTIAARIQDLEAETTEWTGEEPETLLAHKEESEKKLLETDAKLSSLISELSSLNALLYRKKSLETQRAERSLEAGRLQSLCDDLTGNNPAHISFDAWILGIYLEEIIAYANTRLERMSEGRYTIQLNESYRKGNSLSGLELEIFDSWTGKARPSGTLSGGETFMTSISLALGLADSIQTRAGGIQLDAVFIDEGFGSLDESSLERSISILDEIRGSRMVGIISHVGELRNRIPNRIEIMKTGTGSSIKKEMSNA